MLMWMAYAAVVAGLLAAGGLALERISETLGWPRRLPWRRARGSLPDRGGRRNAMTRMRLFTGGLMACAAAATATACGSDTGSTDTGPEVVVETIGDTTVVRTVSGSVWGTEATLVPELSIGELEGAEEYLFGSIYSITVDADGRVFVMDGQAGDIRVFDTEGTYVETVARRGEGPGELSNASSVAVLPDGRVLAHEAGDMLVKVVGPGPGNRELWTYPAGAIIIPVKPLRVDRDGRILIPAASYSGGDFFPYVIVMGANGELLDSLSPPGIGFERPSVEVRLRAPMGGRSTASSAVPLTARHYWTMHPNGHFVTGISSDYRIELGRDDGVLRMERVHEPVAVSDAEREYHRERTTLSMRRTQPDWSWNGPPVPETKRPFRGLVAGRDGRIWVQLWTEASPVDNQNYNPDNPFSDPVIWESPVRYDAFEPDGTYLGALAAPDGFLVSPAEPIFDGDHVWAVSRDELGVQRVVRYRLVAGEAPGP